MNPIIDLQSGKTVSPPELLDSLARTFPLIDQMADTPQDAEWHAEGNVRIHTELVMAAMAEFLDEAEATPEERLVLMLGAALHDIGKTVTTREQEQEGVVRIVSPYHTERGRSYLAPRMPLLGLDQAICDTILGLVAHHHAPKKLVLRKNTSRAHYWRLSRVANARLIYWLERADLAGRTLRSGNGDEALEFLELFRLGAEEAGIWANGDPYAEWRDRIADTLGSGINSNEMEYVLHEAIRDFETGVIHTPEEAVARTYEHRRSHPIVTITCGPSASGKSTWIDTKCDGETRISLDDIREELTGKRDNQSRNGEVLQLAKERLREGLRARKRIVWDATSLRSDGRAMIAGLAHDYHAATRIVSFACPPEVAKSRDRKRKHPVGTKILERQYDRLQWPEAWEAHRVDCVVTGSSS